KNAREKGYFFIEKGFSSFEISSLFQPDLFSKARIMVIREILNNEDLEKQFQKQAKALVSSDDLIILSQFGKVKPTSPFLKRITKDGAKVESFPLLVGPSLDSWLKEKTNSLMAKIDSLALSSLKEICSGDLFCLEVEIKKLACFSSFINRKNVALLSRFDDKTNIFATLDCLAQRNKKKALLLLQKHLNKGENALYLLSMLAFQVRNLILVKRFADLGALKLGLNSFVFSKALGLKDNFALAELENLFLAIFQTDFKIKTGQVEPEEALFDLVASF
ncbi:hypothetical protein FJ208_02275, partial [Candidatus Gribaldobacteria bacterium]|nr:hypothetical protein [Candidatus Gribaldobacteria bacterium]